MALLTYVMEIGTRAYVDPASSASRISTRRREEEVAIASEAVDIGFDAAREADAKTNDLSIDPIGRTWASWSKR